MKKSLKIILIVVVVILVSFIIWIYNNPIKHPDLIKQVLEADYGTPESILSK